MSRISVEIPNDERTSSSSKDPKFSPVFMSPGGTFVKPTRPDVKLTPQNSLAEMDLSKKDITNELSEDIASLNLKTSSGDEGIKGNSIDETSIPGYDGQSWGVKRGDDQDLGLFGGAILITLPSRMEDVSGLRQVPDHQEVFVDKETDISFIIEILEYEEGTSDKEAAEFHFNDLAQCNSAMQSSVESSEVFGAERARETQFMSLICPEHIKCVLTGRQSVTKFKKNLDGNSDEVLIFLAVVRLPKVGTDLLISLNIPCTSSSMGDSVSVKHAAQSKHLKDGKSHSNLIPTIPVEAFMPASTFSCLPEGGAGDINHAEGEHLRNLEFAVQTMKKALSTLKIVNYALFA